MAIRESLKLGETDKTNTIPDGIYHVRIASIEKKISEEKTNDKGEVQEPEAYIMASYAVCGGSPEEWHGRRVFEMLSLRPGNTFQIRQLTQAVGITDDEYDILAGIENGDFLEREFLAAVATEKERKGKDGKIYEARNKVTRRMPLES